jgi:hypothetical protein
MAASVAALLGSLLAAGPATGAEPAAPKKKPARVTFLRSDTAESPSERERRLIRECRGRPDAGVCLGYAR